MAQHLLTDTAIRAAIKAGTPSRLNDGAGLFLQLPAARWRLRIRQTSGDTVRAVGSAPYPECSLKEARAIAAEMRTGHREAAERAGRVTFSDLARQYLEACEVKLAGSTMAKMHSRFERDLLPALGNLTAEEITAPVVRAAVAPIVARGAREIALRAALDVRQVLRRADVPDVLAGLILTLRADQAKVQHRPAVIDEAAVSRIYKALCQNADLLPQVRAMIRFLAMMPVRPGEARLLRWSDIDRETGAITFVQSKTGDAQRLPIPARVAALLDEVAGITAGLPGPFHHLNGKPLSNASPGNAMAACLAGGEFEGMQSAHGWRASFRSIMAAHAPRDVLEGCLGHRAGLSATEAAYMRNTLDAQRLEALEKWGAILTR